MLVHAMKEDPEMNRRQRIQLTRHDSAILFSCFKQNEYVRAESETYGGTPVFDTEAGRVLFIFDHDRDCDSWCCQDLPYDERQEILEDIRESNCGTRYAEIPHISHAEEHEWLEDWATAKGISNVLPRLGIGEALDYLEDKTHLTRWEYEEFVEKKIEIFLLDWLEKLGTEREVEYIWAGAYE